MAAFGDPRANHLVRRTCSAEKVNQAEQLLLMELASLHEPALMEKLKAIQDHNKAITDQIEGLSARRRCERRLADLDAQRLALQSIADAGIVPG